MSRQLNHLELVGLASKDEEYFQTWIGGDIQELAQNYLGIRQWLKLRDAITVLSRFVYFGMTSLSNIPTLGEEFCEAETKQRRWKQLLMIALNNDLQVPYEYSKFAKLFKDIHLVTFFLFGDFYELSKRVTDYSYKTQANDNSGPRSKWIHRLMGFLTLIRMCLEGETLKVDLNIQDQAIRSTLPADDLCLLCSDQRVDPTCTLCGHVFCWKCIQQWVRDRNECPVCRTPAEQSRLVHLINFR